MTGLRVEDAYDINNTAAFTDGNDRHVVALDVVEYGDRFRNSWTPRRGILLDCTSDGDAWVLFRDTKKVEIVKWMNLCKVPSPDEIAPTPKGKHIEDVYPDEGGAVAVAWRIRYKNWPGGDWDLRLVEPYPDGTIGGNPVDAIEPLYPASALSAARQQGVLEGLERGAQIAEAVAEDAEGITYRQQLSTQEERSIRVTGRRIAAAIRGAL